MRITRTEEVLVVDQSYYARDVVKRFSILLNTQKYKFLKAVPFYWNMKLKKTKKISKGQRQQEFSVSKSNGVSVITGDQQHTGHCIRCEHAVSL